MLEVSPLRMRQKDADGGQEEGEGGDTVQDWTAAGPEPETVAHWLHFRPETGEEELVGRRGVRLVLPS